MRASGSSYTVPSSSIRPALSPRSPASARSSVVFPAPFGPTTATVWPGAMASSTSSVKPSSSILTCAARLIPRASSRGEPPVPQSDENEERDDEEHQRENDRRVRIRSFELDVDEERQGLCRPLQVPRERDRGAELTKCPRPAQHDAGDQ